MTLDWKNERMRVIKIFDCWGDIRKDQEWRQRQFIPANEAFSGGGSGHFLLSRGVFTLASDWWARHFVGAPVGLADPPVDLIKHIR
jgi:hypothetical protein